MRGVQKRNSVFVTSSLRGTFRQHDVRDEFLAIIARDGHIVQ
jgi:GTP cyclohydrolase I